MKNDILTCFDKASGKYAAQLFSYEQTPSGSIRPILRLSTDFIFANGLAAMSHLYGILKPEVKQNTNDPIQQYKELVSIVETGCAGEV